MIYSARARRYAQAFVAVFGAVLTLAEVRRLAESAQVLKKKRLQFIHFISSLAGKKQFIQLLTESFCDPAYGKLLRLLQEEHALVLLPEVFLYIEKLYYKIHNIRYFTITSYPELSDSHLKTVQQFIAHGLRSEVIYQYAVDPLLIAGVRACSDQFVWECSVRQRLQHIRQTLID